MSSPRLPTSSRLKDALFLATVVGLSFLCFALREAHAETKGLPQNAAFPTAEFPYARIVSGCTAWRRPTRFGDEWGQVSFASACAEHDRCYLTPGASWGDCNERFLGDLRSACDRDLAQARLAEGRAGGADGQALSLCYQIADLYVGRVQTRAALARFGFAQKQAKTYLDSVRATLAARARKALKREPSTRELDGALAQLGERASLDELEAAWRSRALPAWAGAGRDIDLSESEPASGVMAVKAEAPGAE